MTALFLSPPSLQARDWLSAPCAGPGNFPEAHTRSAPCWASCSTSTRWGRSPGSGPMYGQNVRPATILRPSLEAKNPRTQPVGVNGSGDSFQGVLGNNPQKLARHTQGLCLCVNLETRFQAVWLLLLPKPLQEDG